MKSQLRKILLTALPLAGVLSFTLSAPAGAADRQREERSATGQVSERDLRSFDAYLNEHWETADDLYRDPTLITNERFLRGHSDLRDWLDDHPDAAEAIQANPRKFLWRERATESRTPKPVTQEDLRSLDRYLDTHSDVADELYRDPELITNERFLRGHSDLRDWLDDHPDATRTIQANPQKFLWRDRKLDTSDFLRQLLK